jgi:glucokinase
MQQSISQAPPIEMKAQSAAPQHLFAGVDIGGTNLRIALSQADGTILARTATTTVGIRDADQIVALIRDGVLDLLAQTGHARESLVAIGAGAPGITNADTGVVIATSYLLGWRDVPLREKLEAALGVPAAIDNDVNAAAIGECWMGAGRESSDLVFLAIGTGVGAGIVLHGAPYRGASWLAGEIGYMLVPGVSTDPIRRGEPGALESMVGGEGIRKQWQALWDAEGSTLQRDLTATQIFEFAEQGLEQAQAILKQTARMIAFAIYNVSLVLNCPLFVLGGGVGLHPVLSQAVQAMLREQREGSQPTVVTSALGADAQMFGAIRLALYASSLPPA